MKIKILLLFVVVAGLSSCSTSYKTTQTPDDVYYSPARQPITVTPEIDVYNTSTGYISSEDFEIRRRIYNHKWGRYNYYDTYYYPDGYSYSLYADPKISFTRVYSGPRKFTVNTTTPTDLKTRRPIITSNVPVRTFQNSSNLSTNSGSGVGNFIRKVFNGMNNPNNNSNSSNNRAPERTFEPKNNTNNNSGNSATPSSGSKTSTSAPVRTFGK